MESRPPTSWNRLAAPSVWAAGLGDRPRPPRRLAVSVMLALLGLGLLGVGGAHAWWAAISWVNRQTTYQQEFAKIQLLPEREPSWIRSSPAVLLEQVRLRSGRAEVFSTLELDLNALARDLAYHGPWVDEVLRIERSYPNVVRVHLRYKEPVAFLLQEGSKRYLDREGVVLPEDLDPTAAEPLLVIWGLDLGQRSDGPPTDPRLRAAARLAAFLKARMRERAESSASLRFRGIHVMPADDRLLLMAPDRAWIAWGRAPGAEEPGEPSAYRKWTLLEDHVRHEGSLRVADPETHYWSFTENAVRLRAIKSLPTDM